MNHLRDQQSPYLLQHADNPVHWYPWGPDAFAQAKKLNRPILLSIGYSTCHWCHVMAHESFESEDIAAIINDNFIAIKVDREERPDIDHVYMNAVVASTGQGGWPLTAFLTPDKHMFYGGTYFPPYAKWGQPGFVDVLRSVSAAWRDQRDEIVASIQSALEQPRGVEPIHNVTPSLDETLATQVISHCAQQFDRMYGGFAAAPKFPMAHTLSFLLRYHHYYNYEQALKMAEKTLSMVCRGGIYDHVGGGVHRYSTDGRWHVPHFEKMLYDQALLLRALIDGYQITGELEFRNAGCSIADYVLRVLTDSQGGFYCAEDADSMPVGGSHPQEGAFYVWHYNEVEQILGKDHAAIFAFCYGLKPDGNVQADPHGEFISQNVLYQAVSIKEASVHFNKSEDEIENICQHSLDELFSHRQQRPKPHLDDKVLADWNGLMIAALTQAACVFGEQKYLDAASKAADFILANLFKDEKLQHRWRQGESGIDGMLDDYTAMMLGLIALYEAVGKEQYLTSTITMARIVKEYFWDQEAGGFFMTDARHMDLNARPKDFYDGAMPSGNAMASMALFRLGRLTHDQQWEQLSVKLWQAARASLLERYPNGGTFHLYAWLEARQPPLDISWPSKALSHVGIAQMRKVVYKHFMPHAVFSWGEASGVVVCKSGVCQPPITKADDLEHLILS